MARWLKPPVAAWCNFIDGDSVMINDSNVIAADVEASNGVIHVIDAGADTGRQ